MNRAIGMCCLATLLVGSVADGAPLTLGSGEIALDGGGRMEPGETLLFDFTVGGVTIFSLELDEDDIGQSFMASIEAPSLPDSIEVVSNGTNNNVSYSAAVSSGFAQSSTVEAGFFFDDVSGQSGVDFESVPVVDIEFTVKDLVIDSPGSDPNDDGFWTDFLLEGTVTVQGPEAVPEPATLLLWSGMLAGGWFIAHRRRRLGN